MPESAEKQPLIYRHGLQNRKCIMSPDGQWRHWDEEQDGPLATPPDRVCRWTHEDKARMEFGPDPDVSDALAGDRGDFGMPGLGVRVSPGRTVTPPEETVKWNFQEEGWTYKDDGWTEVGLDRDGLTIAYGELSKLSPAATPEARYVLAVVPQILDMFLEKNRKYAEVQKGYDLGSPGIIPDLNRKLGILKARIWDGASEVGESTDEVIGDMIGHLLLMLAKRNG